MKNDNVDLTFKLKFKTADKMEKNAKLCTL